MWRGRQRSQQYLGVTTLVWGHHEFWNKNHILGHEEMHAKMVLVMFGTLFAGQILLFMWRKKHPRSYNLGMFYLIIPPIISFQSIFWLLIGGTNDELWKATLTGMLFIPICYSIYFGFYRFIFIWVIYSLITGIVCRKVSFNVRLNLSPPSGL